MQQYIARLYIAVDNAMLMSMVDGYTDRGKEVNYLATQRHLAQARRVTNILCQRLPFHVIRHNTHRRGHRVIRMPGRKYINIADMCNVGMMQRSKFL